MTIVARAGRTLLLMLFAGAGTILLVRFAPGFFSDSREMDAKYATAARSEMQAQNNQQQSVRLIAIHQVKSWLHGDLGQSRQYQRAGRATDRRSCEGLGFASRPGHFSGMAAGGLHCLTDQPSAPGRTSMGCALHPASVHSNGGYGDGLHSFRCGRPGAGAFAPHRRAGLQVSSQYVAPRVALAPSSAGQSAGPAGSGLC